MSAADVARKLGRLDLLPDSGNAGKEYLQGVRAAVVSALPRGVDFVTPAWVPACLQRCELLPAGSYRIALVLKVLAEQQDVGYASAAVEESPANPAAAGLGNTGRSAGANTDCRAGSLQGYMDADAAPVSGRGAAPAPASAPPSKDKADTQDDEVCNCCWDELQTGNHVYAALVREPPSVVHVH